MNRAFGLAAMVVMLAWQTQAGWGAAEARGGGPPISVVECRPGSQGETPVPFCEPNTRYELADGESYELPGWISKLDNGAVVLQVNLTRVPHLANRFRKSSPFFRLIQGPMTERAARDFPENQEVVAPIVAHARVASHPDTGELRPEIFLELVKSPALYRPGPTVK